MEYTIAAINFFQSRIEAYLNIWENSSLEDMRSNQMEKQHSPLNVRKALFRQAMGGHLTEGQEFRIVNQDLKWYLHPEFESFDEELKSFIEKGLEDKKLLYYWDKRDYKEIKPEDLQRPFDQEFNCWKYVNLDWDEGYLGQDEAISSLKARWVLHCAYKANKLNEEEIKQLIKLDLAALVCENVVFFNLFELKYITDFLMEQGVWDHLPEPLFCK
jgi:hypothetical protein